MLSVERTHIFDNLNKGDTIHKDLLPNDEQDENNSIYLKNF